MNAIKAVQSVSDFTIGAIDSVLLETQFVLERMENHDSVDHKWNDGFVDVLNRIPSDKRQGWYNHFVAKLDEGRESWLDFPMLVWLKKNG